MDIGLNPPLHTPYDLDSDNECYKDGIYENLNW